MGDHEIPFNSDVNVGELLIKMHVKSKTIKNGNDSDDDENNENKFLDNDNNGKKRKRKRGKAV